MKAWIWAITVFALFVLSGYFLSTQLESKDAGLIVQIIFTGLGGWLAPQVKQLIDDGWSL